MNYQELEALVAQLRDRQITFEDLPFKVLKNKLAQEFFDEVDTDVLLGRLKILEDAVPHRGKQSMTFVAQNAVTSPAIPHGFAVAPSQILVTVQGGALLAATYNTLTATDFKITCYVTTAANTSGTIAVDWVAYP